MGDVTVRAGFDAAHHVLGVSSGAGLVFTAKMLYLHLFSVM